MKSFRISIWTNERQTAPNQPGFKGVLEIPAAEIAALYEAICKGQGLEQNRNGEQVVKLWCSFWRQYEGKAVMSGVVETLAEAAAWQQRAQQPLPQQGWQQPAGPTLPGEQFPQQQPPPVPTQVPSSGPWSAPQLPQQQAAPQAPQAPPQQPPAQPAPAAPAAQGWGQPPAGI